MDTDVRLIYKFNRGKIMTAALFCRYIILVDDNPDALPFVREVDKELDAMRVRFTWIQRPIEDKEMMRILYGLMRDYETKVLKK